MVIYIFTAAFQNINHTYALLLLGINRKLLPSTGLGGVTEMVALAPLAYILGMLYIHLRGEGGGGWGLGRGAAVKS